MTTPQKDINMSDNNLNTDETYVMDLVSKKIAVLEKAQIEANKKRDKQHTAQLMQLTEAHNQQITSLKHKVQELDINQAGDNSEEANKALKSKDNNTLNISGPKHLLEILNHYKNKKISDGVSTLQNKQYNFKLYTNNHKNHLLFTLSNIPKTQVWSLHIMLHDNKDNTLKKFTSFLQSVGVEAEGTNLLTKMKISQCRLQLLAED
jgi:hypothetical protein